MKRLASLAIALSLGLAGCGSDDLFRYASAAATLEAKPAAAVPAEKVDLAAIGRTAVCDWAKAAGVPELKLARWDSAETKRQIAALHGAHQATCAAKVKPPEPPGNAPAKAVEAPPPIKK